MNEFLLEALLPQILRWEIVLSPQHTEVCLRVKTHSRFELEPKSFF